MQRKIQYITPRLIDLATALLSFVLFVLSFKLNSLLDRTLLYAPGISLLFIPAGIKLLCIVLGRAPAIVGLFLASVYLSSDLWQDLAVISYYYFAAVSLFTYSLAVFLTFRIFKISSTLANLKFHHILFMSIAACALNGILHNLVFIAQGVTNYSELWSRSAAMSFGDFTGCIVVISVFNLSLQIIQRQSTTTI
jgi:hypothetical protein